MSAYVVEKKVIDALVTYGLRSFPGSGSATVSWFWPSEIPAGAYERGQAIPAASVVIAQERRAELTDETADRIGQVLWAENVRSVNHRYDEYDPSEPYHFKRYPVVIDPANILGIISCLTYQSCEHPEWEQSEAFAILEAIRRKAIRRLPGYEWSLPK